jgi:RNA polymerase sigma-70 factor (ECF subfamily)
MQGEDVQGVELGWERLARSYWQPLYAFLRRRGADHHAACDDVQGFFAHLLSKPFLRQIQAGTALFRSFLLQSLQNWRADQHRAATAQKRGGGQVPLPLAEAEFADTAQEGTTPEEAYDLRWARAVYDHALALLQERLTSRGRSSQFEKMRGLLTGQGVAKYQEIAADLGMTEGAVKQAASELRREFGVVLREEIRKTVAQESQVDGEIRYLLGLLRKGS